MRIGKKIWVDLMRIKVGRRTREQRGRKLGRFGGEGKTDKLLIFPSPKSETAFYKS